VRWAGGSKTRGLRAGLIVATGAEKYWCRVDGVDQVMAEQLLWFFGIVRLRSAP
jgi:hypothetical protein